MEGRAQGCRVRRSLGNSEMLRSHAESLGSRDMVRFAFETVTLEADGEWVRGLRLHRGELGRFLAPSLHLHNDVVWCLSDCRVTNSLKPVP